LQSHGFLKSQDVEKKSFFALFWKNDFLQENFQRSVSKKFIASQSDV